MPTYLFVCEKCSNEFEDFLSIKAPIPQDCPNCKECGHIKRLISGGSGKGIVELTGNELKEKIKNDTIKLKQEIRKDPNKLANIVGESKFNKMVK